MKALNRSVDLNSPALHEAEKAGKFHCRAYLLSEVLPALMNQTADFIKSVEDDVGVRFRLACDFMEYDLEDVFSASVESLSRCGFFPYAELSYEFDAFQTLLLQGRYKHTRDSMRRMLDVSVTAVMYLLGLKDVAEARDWIYSKGETPQYSRMVRILSSHPLIDELNGQFRFEDAIKHCYWNLCDYCHTRGIEYSTGIRKGSQMNFNGIVLPAFNEEECRKVMTQFVEVVGLMAVLFVSHNPTLLAPVDKDAKWGLNPPISGFFYGHQTERMLNVMSREYAEYFKGMAKTDPVIVAMQDYFDKLPDITEEEMQIQADEINKEMVK